jgi:DNA-cytosine methyltransferase
MYKILDLFSGLGGFSLGLERTGHFKTIAFCDNDKFSKLILDKHWKGVKVYNDVREITKEKFKEDGIEFPDIITGGFPCQPFSVAGKQKGTSDDRHLWPEMFRIIKAFKPRYVIGENVRGIVNIQEGVVFETVCTDLESEGYEVQPFIIPAAGVGAPHRRERVWIIATNTESKRTGQNDEGLWQRSSRISRGEGTSRAKDVGNTQHNGSFTNEIGRRNEEINGGTEKRENRSFEFERTSRREDNEDMENPRRTLRSRGELGETNEDETRKENADQFKRSSSTSRSNVADTERERLQGGYKRDKGEGRQILPSEQNNRGEIRSEARRFSRVSGQADVADTVSERGRSRIAERQDAEDVRQSSQSSNTGWWDFEPNVGRVAHGVRGRVHRLKGLGNSIVPQIVEEIGRAIIKAEHEME